MRLQFALSVVIVLSAWSIYTYANAQSSFSEAESTSRDSLFEQRRAFGGISEFTYLRQSWSVNTFYTAFRGHYPTQSRFWVIKRVTGGTGESEAVRWADSRSCSAVELVLIAMEKMPAVRPDAPQLGIEAENLGFVLDGTQHIFWSHSARSGQNDAAVRLEITGNVNSPIAEWWADATDRLEPCWSTVMPE